jgi:hypothetical protein
MADIEVRTGLVSEVFENGAGITLKFGEPPMMLSIGAMPSRVRTVTLVPMEVDPGEYLAVAISKSLLQPLNYVLLAYRRPRGEVHATNFTLAAWGVVAGVAGLAASTLADTIQNGIAAVAVSSAVLVPGAVRLFSVRKAKLLLAQWRESA